MNLTRTRPSRHAARMGVFSHLFAWGQRRAREGKSAKQEARLQSRVQAERLAAESARKRRLDLPQPGKLERGVHSTGTYGHTGESVVDPAERGEELDLSDLDKFLKGEMAIMADSSNVDSFSYQPKLEHLYVTYKAKGNRPASKYGYSPISLAEASAFFGARSKGSQVWDQLRIRGTVKGHRKQYWQIF